MKLKIVDSPAIPGGKAIVAFDDADAILPMQIACELDQSVGNEVHVKITFRVDGKKVRLVNA